MLTGYEEKSLKILREQLAFQTVNQRIVIYSQLSNLNMC